VLKQRAPHPARLTGRREAESNEAHALANAPKHTVLSMTGLTSPVWTIGMVQMVSGLHFLAGGEGGDGGGP
jgi:hypothetical protein